LPLPWLEKLEQAAKPKRKTAARKPRAKPADALAAAVSAEPDGAGQPRPTTAWISLRRLALRAVPRDESQLLAWVSQARCREADVRDLFWAHKPSEAGLQELRRYGLAADSASLKQLVTTAGLGLPVRPGPQDKDTWCSSPSHWFDAINKALERRGTLLLSGVTKSDMDAQIKRLRWALYQLYFFLRQLGLRVQSFPGCELRPFWSVGDWGDTDEWDRLGDLVAACTMDLEGADDFTKLSATETKLPPEGPWKVNLKAARTPNETRSAFWTALCLFVASKMQWRFLYVNGDGTVPKEALSTEDGRNDRCNIVLEGAPLFVAHARHFVSVVSFPRLDPKALEDDGALLELGQRLVCLVHTGSGWVDSYVLESGWDNLESVNLSSATLAPVPVPRRRPLARHWCLRWGGTHCFRFRMVEQLVELNPSLALTPERKDALDQHLVVPFPGHGLPNYAKVKTRLFVARSTLKVAFSFDEEESHDSEKRWDRCNGVVVAVAAALAHRVYATMDRREGNKINWLLVDDVEEELRVPWNLETTPSDDENVVNMTIEPLQVGPPPPDEALHVRPGRDRGQVELNAAKPHAKTAGQFLSSFFKHRNRLGIDSSYADANFPSVSYSDGVFTPACAEYAESLDDTSEFVQLSE
jgi:hypothetical protein